MFGKLTLPKQNMSGAFGLCVSTMAPYIPPGASLQCNPANQIPQICTLICPPGQYSAGADMDLACSDNLCVGNCSSRATTVTFYDVEVSNRTCSYSAYEDCSSGSSSSGSLCLREWTEPCSVTEYVERSYPSCTLEQPGLPTACPRGGCSGSCESPGIYTMSAVDCPTGCPPIRDPEAPQFLCLPCWRFADPPNTLTVEGVAAGTLVTRCAPGYFGAAPMITSCTTAGMYGPLVPTSVTMPCVNTCMHPVMPVGPHVRIDITAATNDHYGEAVYFCEEGWVGETVWSRCDDQTGVWTSFVEPTCLEPSVSPTPSTEPSATPSVSLVPSRTPSRTPSKTPKPPKVLGSRAPSPSQKIRLT